MNRYPIHFQNTEDVAKFVRLANHLSCDVDLISGNRMVDGKSLLGAIAISEAPELYAVVHSDLSGYSDRFLRELRNFSHTSFVA